jgi:hypothetical protein
MKQTEVNPWDSWREVPAGTVVEGEVRNLANYGAFIEIEPGIDGLLHISDMSWTKKVTHPNELLKKGDDVECVVLEVDQEKQRVSPWGQAAHRGPVGRGHPRPTSPAWSSAARSPRSPTSASSSSWRTISRACCTSPSSPITREQREAAGEPKTIKQRRGGLHGAGEQTSGLIPSLPTKPPAVDPAAAEGDAAADDASAGDAKAEDGDASDAPESTTEEDKGGA